MSLIARVGACGVLAFCVAVASAPAVAVDNNQLVSVQEYEKMNGAGEMPDLGPMYWYHAGMQAGLEAVQESHGKAGAPRLFCMPPSFGPRDLRNLIAGELALDGHTWRRASGATPDQIALYALRTKHPC